MVISVGGTTVGETYVTSSEYLEYEFTFSTTSDPQEIKVIFDNDVYVPPLFDRDLIVDKVIIDDC